MLQIAIGEQHMTRTKLADRKLPYYTRGEEIANMTTHIVGGAFGVATLVLCTVFPVLNKNYWALAGGIIYGLMMIFLYAMNYDLCLYPSPTVTICFADLYIIFSIISKTNIIGLGILQEGEMIEEYK